MMTLTIQTLLSTICMVRASGVVLEVPFGVDGRLVLREGVNKPYGRAERLFFEGKQSFSLDDMSKLKGRVHINSKSEALSYVRLRTSPLTFHGFWGHDEAEVSSYSDYKNMFHYGISRNDSILSSHSFLDGIVDDPDILAGIPKPKVIDVSGHFVINRTIVRSTSTNGAYWLHGPFAVDQIKETVGTDGYYQVSVTRTLFSLAHLPWRFQTLETVGGIN